MPYNPVALLTQDLGIATSVLKPTQADDEILIVNEYAGFPLRLIGSLERMRNPYMREQNSATSFLHNDYRTTFPDLIPPDARTIEELEDVFYPCLAFGLLQENNRAKRRFELERLQQDFADGFMTDAERDRERQKIFDKYPL